MIYKPKIHKAILIPHVEVVLICPMQLRDNAINLIVEPKTMLEHPKNDCNAVVIVDLVCKNYFTTPPQKIQNKRLPALIQKYIPLQMHLSPLLCHAEEADAVRKRKKVTRTQRHQSKQQCMEGTPTQDKIL